MLFNLSLNAFFVGLFSEIHLISVKIISLNDFCDLEQVLSLAYRDLLFDSLLELSKTRPPEISKNKTQN